MILTQGQEKGLKIAVERYRHKEPFTVIAGKAGTGKTTLVAKIIEALGLYPFEVAYIAFTGKASLVLKNKGCQNAMTAHKLLYNTKEKPDGTFEFLPKDALDKDYKVIVLDECGMLPDEMWQLLLSFHIYVIALGDNFQLPPVNGSSSILEKPHVVLDEIVRQALDSPIIRLSSDIIEGKKINFGNYDENGICKIISRDKLSNRLLLGADQVLCGKNATRFFLNRQMRQTIFKDKFQDGPIENDKIICLKNSWDVLGRNMSPLINGMIGTIHHIALTDTQMFKPKMYADFDFEYDYFKAIHMDYKIFTENKTTINKENWIMYPKLSRPKEFDYGYAITVHKAQGSEFEKIVVFDEWLGDFEFHQRWLYTAVTRASEKLFIVR